MSTPIRVASGADLGAGQIQFYQAIQPPLVSNLYLLNAKQTIELKSEQPSYQLQQPFSIAGPRFRLQSSDVQQVYPPANLTGSYEESLPHIVLRQRTLPWSRTIDGSVAKDGDVPTPWLALLTLYPEDLAAHGQPATVADLVKQTTVGDLLTADAALVPAIDTNALTADELKEPLLAIELPQLVFWSIAPTLSELPFLAHARQVNTDGKELLGLDADGFFSLVMGNRFPKPDARNVVMLVSVEGHQAHLPVDGQPPPAGAATRTVRLAVLASWSFTSAPARGDFLQIMQDLPKRGGVGLLQMPHDDFAGQLSPAATTARKALELGYVPLLNNTRSGEETTSWYRGPGAPLACATDPGPYLFSDHAIRYDPGPDNTAYAGTGTFDMSYACAWQIGRLLALSDMAFAASLLEWRRRQHVDQNQQQTMADVPERVPVAAARFASLAAAAPAPTLDVARSAVAMFLQSAAPAIEQPQLPKTQIHERRTDAALAGVLAPADLQAAIEAPGDPLYNLVQRVLAIAPASRSGERS